MQTLLDRWDLHREDCGHLPRVRFNKSSTLLSPVGPTSRRTRCPTTASTRRTTSRPLGFPRAPTTFKQKRSPYLEYSKFIGYPKARDAWRTPEAMAREDIAHHRALQQRWCLTARDASACAKMLLREDIGLTCSYQEQNHQVGLVRFEECAL